jgi:hypothetical protein
VRCRGDGPGPMQAGGVVKAVGIKPHRGGCCELKNGPPKPPRLSRHGACSSSDCASPSNRRATTLKGEVGAVGGDDVAASRSRGAEPITIG